MERLTEKHYLGTDHYMKCSGNCNVDMDCIDCPSFDCLVERLAAYEDTWLEPEEITAMQQTLDEYHKVRSLRSWSGVLQRYTARRGKNCELPSTHILSNSKSATRK